MKEKQALIQFRIEQDFKQEAEQICNQLGMDIPTVLRMCLRQLIIQRGIPFSVHLPDKKEASADSTVEPTANITEKENEEVFKMDLGGINREVEVIRKENKI